MAHIRQSRPDYSLGFRRKLYNCLNSSTFHHRSTPFFPASQLVRVQGDFRVKNVSSTQICHKSPRPLSTIKQLVHFQGASHALNVFSTQICHKSPRLLSTISHFVHFQGDSRARNVSSTEIFDSVSHSLRVEMSSGVRFSNPEPLYIYIDR